MKFVNKLLNFLLATIHPSAKRKLFVLFAVNKEVQWLADGIAQRLEATINGSQLANGQRICYAITTASTAWRDEAFDSTGAGQPLFPFTLSTIPGANDRLRLLAQGSNSVVVNVRFSKLPVWVVSLASWFRRVSGIGIPANDFVLPLLDAQDAGFDS